MAFPRERRLFELLEEQQEQFLSENGHSDKIFHSHSLTLCFPCYKCRRLFRISTIKCLLTKLFHGKFIRKSCSSGTKPDIVYVIECSPVDNQIKDKSLLSSIHKSAYNENKIELEKNRELIIDKIVIEIGAAIFDEMLAEIVLQMLELFH
ncbi:DHS-like NAD/FAD-binding domain-containing protein [Dioscorea alata]|uniref:DHS-like NAD/FAD-binding domain-containing protein n=1 Tax=Dioscorea alata TaxID=55571 RepID=A0ACB7UKC5_DIOAL|nr:DHS-like NAD/FAD-binding domain-containing protein [Dioscorea alata]